MEHYLGVAKELGMSGSEIGAVQASVMAVAAGKVNAQVREASERSRASAERRGILRLLKPVSGGRVRAGRRGERAERDGDARSV